MHLTANRKSSPVGRLFSTRYLNGVLVACNLFLNFDFDKYFTMMTYPTLAKIPGMMHSIHLKPLLSVSLYLLSVMIGTAQNIGIGTATPRNTLETHGNLLVTATNMSTDTLPTTAQTKTLLLNQVINFLPSDSVGRIYDPGGPSESYPSGMENNTLLYYCNIPLGAFPSTGIQVEIDSIDIGEGDSLIIKTTPLGPVLLAIGYNFATSGNYIFSTTSLYIQFESNDDGLVGNGFSLLFKRIYPTPDPSNVTGYCGNTFYFDSKDGTLRSGIIAPQTNGPLSTALGDKNQAIGGASVAMGAVSIATGSTAIAMGFACEAHGDLSVAMGGGTLANGGLSTAMGGSTTANGEYATSMGEYTEANGYASTSMGFTTQANGSFTAAHGRNTESNGYAGTALGMYNAPILASPQTAVTEDTPLFIIGNGSSNTNRSNAMVVRKDGNVGLGTNNPRITLHVAAGTDAGLLDDDGFLLIGNVNGINLVMDNNEIQARDDAAISDLYMQKEGGKVFIGAPVSPSFLLSVNGTAGKNGGGSWSSYSDMRLKENIHAYSDGLDAVLKINPVWFQYTALSGYDPTTKYVGVIAQELQEVSPYMVTTTEPTLADGTSGYLQVDNSAMTYMLINAVKELHAEIKNLKSEIQALRKAK